MPLLKPKRGAPSWLRAAGVGTELVAAIIGFTLLGLWIDRSFGTQPWGVLIGVVLGFVGGFYNFFRSSRRAMGLSGPKRPENKASTVDVDPDKGE